MTHWKRAEAALSAANERDVEEEGVACIVAAIEAAVAEEREAVAALAEEVEATYEVHDYEDAEAKAKGGYACSAQTFADLIRARGRANPSGVRGCTPELIMTPQQSQFLLEAITDTPVVGSAPMIPDHLG